MNKYEHKTGRGSMFVNNRKEKDSEPDRKGDAKVACPHCKAEFEAWLSGWLDKTKDGSTYLSMSIKAKDIAHNEGMAQAKQAAATNPAPASEPFADGGDDIPF